MDESLAAIVPELVSSAIHDYPRFGYDMLQFMVDGEYLTKQDVASILEEYPDLAKLYSFADLMEGRF